MTFSPMHQLHSNKTPIKSSNLRTSSIPLLVGVTKLWSPVPFRIGKVQKETTLNGSLVKVVLSLFSLVAKGKSNYCIYTGQRTIDTILSTIPRRFPSISY